MKVNLGDKSVEVEENTSLVSFLENHALFQQQGIAVAVNDSVIPKTMWNSQILNQGDTITVIKATAGG